MKTLPSAAFALGSMFFVLFLFSCSDNQKSEHQGGVKAGEPTNEQLVKKGEYYVEIMGCNDCHSPKKMGPNGPEVIAETMLSGFPADRPIAKINFEMIKSGFSVFYPDLTAAAGPWGISFAANLTPDSTGIGNWTEDQFKTAIRQGKYKGLEGNRMLLPPMPWVNYKNLSDEDVRSIFAYLKSIKPVRNLVPQPIAPGKS